MMFVVVIAATYLQMLADDNIAICIVAVVVVVVIVIAVVNAIYAAIAVITTIGINTTQ